MATDTTQAVLSRRQQLVDLDRDHVWHPFTPMKQWREADPLMIERAEGCFLIDAEGRRYIDGVSSLWCNVHGHRVPQIDQAIRDQLDKVAHTTLLGLASLPSARLAARLCAIAPGPPGRLNKVFFSDSGATAVEVALKMAVGYWYHRGQSQRCRFIGFCGGYHGDTAGSMSVGFSDLFHRPFVSMVFPTYFAPVPDPCRTSAGLSSPSPGSHVWPSEDAVLNQTLRAQCLGKLEELLEQHAHEVAAIVIEPLVQGAAGIVCQPPGFLRGVADLARQHDTLLIADEVATGFGRTGSMFACEHEHVGPDLLCLAKGITAGYLPLAATLATDEIEGAFCGELAAKRTLLHGHTYTGNALGCAAALACLDLFEQNRLLDHITESARIIRKRLDALRDCPHVLDVRQRGVMAGIELCHDRRGGQTLDVAERTGHQVCLAMRSKGLILRSLGDVIVLMPVPAMPHETLHRMLEVVIETILEWQFDPCPTTAR